MLADYFSLDVALQKHQNLLNQTSEQQKVVSKPSQRRINANIRKLLLYSSAYSTYSLKYKKLIIIIVLVGSECVGTKVALAGDWCAPSWDAAAGASQDARLSGGETWRVEVDGST